MPRLLVVEDDPGVRETLDTLFTLEGFAVSLVAGTDAAIAALETEPFDLVVSDFLGLTTGGGATSADGLQALHSAAAPTPIILLTAHAPATEWSPADIGTVAIVAKPFDVTDLVAIVRSYVGKST